MKTDLKITVKNRNEAPSIVVVEDNGDIRPVSRKGFRVAESLPPGFVVGRFQVFDPEPALAETFSFKLQKYQDLFGINSVTCVSEVCVLNTSLIYISLIQD